MSLIRRWHWPPLGTYCLSIAAVVLALTLTLYAQSIVEGNLMLLCLVAVTVSAWYGGTGPGIVATLAAIVGTDYLFGPSEFDAIPAEILTDRLRPGLFAAVAILISALSGAKKHAEEDLDRTLASLERSVQERTEELSSANVALHAANAALQAQIAGRIAAEDSYRELFENATDIIYTLDLDGAFISLNKAGERMLGYSADHTARLNFACLVSPKYAKVVHGMLANLLEGSPPKATKLELLAKDGRLVPVEASVRLIHRDGRPVGLQGIARDLSERDRLESELRQAQKLESIGRLAGGVAHDFNNLLMVIQGYSDILLSQLTKDSRIYTDLEEIRRAAERGATLTRQLLAFSRKQVLHVAPLELNRLVRDTVKILGLLLGEKVRLDLRLATEPCPIEADRSQLEQVLVNLAANARDAMAGTGTLTIEVTAVDLSEHESTGKAGRYIRLRVTDTGCGMDEGTKAQLFEPFFTTKPLGKGTGLGLATAYGVVKQLGGHIEVDSAPRQGATFTVYFPETQKKVVDSPERVTPEASITGKETVLLVEDDAAVRAISLTALESYGYRALQASSPKEALKVAATHADEIALVLSDVMMPEMTGPEMAALLKNICPKARVLYISGYATDALVHDGVLPGDVTLIQKPIAVRELLEVVRRTLDAPVSSHDPVSAAT